MCPRFTYGNGCFERCGNCANGATCDHVTGTCSQGCMPGYTGIKCDAGKRCWNKYQYKRARKVALILQMYDLFSVCEIGFYGENCQLPCDSCRDLKCHHVTGQCLDNCRPGWKNMPFCDQSESFADVCFQMMFNQILVYKPSLVMYDLMWFWLKHFQNALRGCLVISVSIFVDSVKMVNHVITWLVNAKMVVKRDGEEYSAQKVNAANFC